MQESIMEQGVNLTLYGMGTVFVFLTLLVIATTCMSAFVSRYFPDPELPAPRKPAAKPATGVSDPTLLAVIKAAVDQHRAKRK